MSGHPTEAVLAAALAAARARRPVALCTVVATKGSAPQTVGAMIAVPLDGDPVGTVGGGRVEWATIEEARRRLREGEDAGLLDFDLGELGMSCGGGMSVFVDTMVPRERMLIFGAGHVGQALAALAAALDFHVVVVDDRPEWAHRERFPDAGEIAQQPFGEFLAGYEPGGDDYAVIVTRGHEHDEEVLRALVGRPLRYLGMMGSSRKVAGAKKRLRADGVTDEALARVDAPIGLPIGAVTPAELAVSILGRIVATRRDVDVGALGAGKRPPRS